MTTPPILRALRIRREELPLLLLAAGAFFFILCGYYLLRPVREEFGIDRGKETLVRLAWITFSVMLLAVPVFGWTVSHLRRSTFVPLIYGFFALNILLFWAGHRWFPSAHVALGQAFFVWITVYNLFSVSLFWSVLVDRATLEAGKRIFALVALGGTSGAIAGSLLASQLVTQIGRLNLLLVAAAMLATAAHLLRFLSRREHVAHERPEPPSNAGFSAHVREQFALAFAGLTRTARSPYLIGICLYILALTFTSTFIYYLRVDVIQDAYPDRDERAAFLANIDAATNGLTLFAQLFLTARLIGWIGVGPTLMILPAVSAAGFALIAGYSGSSLVLLLAGVEVARRAANYAIARPARETLYTVTSDEDKYKSKSFIDTFVYRGGDAASASMYVHIDPQNDESTQQLALIALPVSLVWGALGFGLAKGQTRRAAALARSPDNITPRPESAAP